MIDYTIGDKVVCIDDDPVDFAKILAYRLHNFQYPLLGHIYTIRDMAPPEAFLFDSNGKNDPGVLLHELTAGTDCDGDEWWFGASSFRKALPADLAVTTRRTHQPA